MTKVKVNKYDVEVFNQNAITIYRLSENNRIMAIPVNNLISDINSQINKVNNSIQTLESNEKKLDIAIASLSAKIVEKGVELSEKVSELASKPKTIPPGIPNPLIIPLAAEIASLKSDIASLNQVKNDCENHKNSINNNRNEMQSIKEKLNNAKRQLEEMLPKIRESKNKIAMNSENASKLLKNLISIIDEYINTKHGFYGNYFDFENKQKIINSVNSGKTILGQNGSALTKEMGNYGEMRTSVEMEQNGYYEMTNSPNSLNDKLTHGIDHIFYKDDHYYIVDSKSGPGAHLEPETATGPQLSDTWINARLDIAVGKDVADIIREKMILEPESFHRLVSRVNVGEETIYGLVDSNGKIIKEGAKIDELLNI